MKKNLFRGICLILSMVTLIMLFGCELPSQGNTPGTEGGGEDHLSIRPAVYITTPKDYVKFVRQDTSAAKVYDKSQLDESKGYVVTIDPNTTYQVVEGWGCAITESSAINLLDMPEETRNAVMKALFSEDDGIGLNLIRLPNGISDFSVDSNFSYAPVEGDLELEHFTLGKHKEMIVPLVLQAKQLINNDEDFKVFLASWTAPLWMKTIPEFHSSNRSTLKREYYKLFANYLVKSIQAYEAEGIPIFSISPQNEFTGVHGIAAMYMSVDNMATLINFYLKPALDDAGLDTKILAWDFNSFDDSTAIIGQTYQNIGVVGYHAYSGAFDLFKKNQELFPNLPFYVTEAAGMKQAPQSRFFRQMRWINDSMRVGSSGHILWNIVLDEEGGPALIDDKGQSVNTIGVGMLEWNRQEKKVAYLEDFYALAHFSKFVRPGAVRVDSTDLNETVGENVQNVVFKNENGAMTAVLTNNDASEHCFLLVIGDTVIECTVPGKSAATVTWKPNA